MDTPAIGGKPTAPKDDERTCDACGAATLRSVCDPCATRLWDRVQKNRGLVVSYIRRRLTWACGRHDVYDDIVQIGLTLLFKAAKTYDPNRTTFGGWAIRVLDAQLLHRVREEQGLQDRPDNIVFTSLHEVGDEVLDAVDKRPTEEVSEERQHRSAALQREALEILRRLISDGKWSGFFGQIMYEAVVARTIDRDVPCSQAAITRALSYGIRETDIEAVVKRWAEVARSELS